METTRLRSIGVKSHNYKNGLLPVRPWTGTPGDAFFFFSLMLLSVNINVRRITSKLLMYNKS